MVAYSENRIDKFCQAIYNSDMTVYGKKQIDIREDNKSAVIDILLQKESTMLQMSERLKLSHTALAKVIKELTQKNIVQLTEMREVNSGRPPKVYGINGECAIACAVVISVHNIYIYYVDMRGFQINEISCANRFENLDSLLHYVTGQVKALKAHPRLIDKILKYIYVGIPSAQFYGREFFDACGEVEERFRRDFPDLGVIVRRNIDCEMAAETKYGVLKNGEQNAVLLNFDRYVCASFLFNGSIYGGENKMQGYDSRNGFSGLENISDTPFDSLAARYCGNEGEAVGLIEEKTADCLRFLGDLLRFLDVNKIVFGGKVKRLGENFLKYVRSLWGARDVCYSSMGTDVPAALSGAVWLSTYSTLQEVMVR